MWNFLKSVVVNFIDDEALSRGAAIAFYTVTSLGPVLLIVISIAGLAFGQEAAQGAIFEQLTGLMGRQASEAGQAALAGASAKSSGILATVIGVATLIATASGMFGEMQTALNKIWRAEPKSGTVSRLIRARAASLGLVAALGFLLAVSLVASAALSAFGDYLDARLPGGQLILAVINFLVSLTLLSVLFAAIYKVLPDRPIAWRDVAVGAVVTALLFNIGKTLIGWYLGSSAVASSYGAAGGIIILFFWVYYSTQVFLVGAEFTKEYATRRGRGPAPSIAATSAGASSGSAPARAPRPASVREAAPPDGLTALQRAEWEAAHHREALVDAIESLNHRMTPAVMKRDFIALVRRKTDAVVSNARKKPLHAAVFLGAVTATGVALARLRHPARMRLHDTRYQVE